MINVQLALSVLLFMNAGIAMHFAARYGGVLVLCGGTLAGFFAYGCSLLVPHWGWAATLLGVGAMATAMSVGLTCLWARLQRQSFELFTLCIALAGDELFRQAEWVTGGVYGITGVPVPFEGAKMAGGALVTAAVMLTAALAWSAAVYVRSGLRSAALLRLQCRMHAETLGLSPARCQGTVFLILCLGLALVGVLSCWSIGGVHPDSFGMELNILCLVAGGIFGQGQENVLAGSLFCLLFGAGLEMIRFLPLSGTVIGNIQQIIFSVLLIYVLWKRQRQPQDHRIEALDRTAV